MSEPAPETSQQAVAIALEFANSQSALDVQLHKLLGLISHAKSRGCPEDMVDLFKQAMSVKAQLIVLVMEKI